MLYFEFTHLINKILKLDEFMFTFCIFMTFAAFYSVFESMKVPCNLSVQAQGRIPYLYTELDCS